MISHRLELALDRLKPSDWQRFERLASQFLASEFDELRTVAAPSGDDGRDAELFSPGSEPSVLLQYSVASNWEKKIMATAKRIGQTFPAATMLVFVSNQEIGARADGVRRTLRTKHGLALDVRDRSWFVDRVLGSVQRERAAEELARVVVDPYLASVGVAPQGSAELSSREAIAAVTFLALQWQDDTREKGLTKLAFEAIVRAVLSDTDSDKRLTRAAIHAGVEKLLPGHPAPQLGLLVDNALRRVTKRSVRHWRENDEFCLSHEEANRAREFQAQAAVAEAALSRTVNEIAEPILLDGPAAQHLGKFSECVRLAADAFLLERSQSFALAVSAGDLPEVDDLESSATIAREVARANLPNVKGIDWPASVRIAVRELLLSDDPLIGARMRSLADAYTLMAFLKQTPDVQAAVEKMFSDGEVWLDTSVVLPLLAEPLFEGVDGRFTRMFRAAQDAGLRFFVTSGVVEEVERHMNRALTCAQLTHVPWRGSTPYLLSRYVSSGRARASFRAWLEQFRGEARPEQDIKDYLREEHSIESRDLEAERDAADPDLLYALQDIWHATHQRRRENSELDDITISRLVDHDVECYCGVVRLRTQQRVSPFGYTAWWLTLDSQAFGLKSKLRERMDAVPPDSPVLSADFLVNYLAFGPVRSRVGKKREASLPILMELGNAASLSSDLMNEAEQIRSELQGLPERVIRRRVRDHLDRARRHIGPVARAGLTSFDDELGSGDLSSSN